MEHVTQALARAFNIPPANNEAPDCANSPDPFAHPPHHDFDSDGQKQQATFKANLALLGFTLHELSSGSFLVCRWDRSRHLVDLRAVAAFLRQAGGAHA